MFKLKEAAEKGDNKRIISALIALRKTSINDEIDKNTFLVLIDLIKVPNEKVINYTLSILANICSNDSYRTLFKERGGVSHLLLVTKNLECEAILCRACRLIGNLACNRDVAEELCKNNAETVLLELLEKSEITADTQLMIFRALKKLWVISEHREKMLPDDLWITFSKTLSSDNTKVNQNSLEYLSCLAKFKVPKKTSKLKISRDFIVRLVDISKTKELNYVAVMCLTNFIIHQTKYLTPYFEGLNIAETFIDYVLENSKVRGEILQAFLILCSEAGMRNKVKSAGLLPKLLEVCDTSNVTKLLGIFYLFQYDSVSMTVLAQNPKFTSILIDNIFFPGAVCLLATLSRLDPPVKELVLVENLNVFIKNKNCVGILKNISRKSEFLKALLISGKVWEIEKAGCSLEDVGSLGHSEGLIIHLLNSEDKQCREDVSLAIPFLVKPRNFELLYKLLAHHQVIKIILSLLKENPTEEKVLASIIRLINIFRFNYHQSDSFFQDLGDSFSASGTADPDNDFINMNCETEENQITNESTEAELLNKEIITFELDNGSCVVMNKSLMCKSSPVFDSMLNGHFVEAKKAKVRLRYCSKEALQTLAHLLNEDCNLSNIRVEIYLELLSLTDRFLLESLNNYLTSNLIIDQTSCSLVYQWYRKAGHTRNNFVIRQKIYEFLFTSSDNLLLAMSNETCRDPLVAEISNYLSNCLVDLL